MYQLFIRFLETQNGGKFIQKRNYSDSFEANGLKLRRIFPLPKFESSKRVKHRIRNIWRSPLALIVIENANKSNRISRCSDSRAGVVFVYGSNVVRKGLLIYFVKGRCDRMTVKKFEISVSLIRFASSPRTIIQNVYEEKVCNFPRETTREGNDILPCEARFVFHL